MKIKISVFLFLIINVCAFAELKRIPKDFDFFEPPRPFFERLERPYKTKKLENENDCEICIKSNEFNASVYINGKYEGTTDLIIKDLRPGRYVIDIEKKGFEPDRFVITVKKGMYQEYRINLIQIVGRIYIHDLPSDSYVFIDNSLKNSAINDVPPGYHKIEVRRFGYNSYSENVYVYAYKVSHVFPEFTEARFSLYGLKSSKEIINPNYKNSFGSTELSFQVTKNGTAVMEIENQNGEIIWKKDWKSFSTWTQSVTWTPDSSLSDGIYLVTVKSGDFLEKINIILDRNYTYNMSSISSYGAGIGNLPSVFGSNMSLVVPYFSFGGFFNENENKNFVNLQAGIFWDFAKHFELNFSFGGGTNKLSLDKQKKIATSFKIYNNNSISEMTKFCYGGLIHYGATFDMNDFPLGIANGNGLGFSGILGFDFSKFYLGFSSDYIFASYDGLNFDLPSTWKNAFATSWRFNNYINFNFWAGINSSFCMNSDYFNDFLRGINFGGEIVFMFGNSSLMGNIKFDANLVPKDESLFYVGFCLSYLF